MDRLLIKTIYRCILAALELRKIAQQQSYKCSASARGNPSFNAGAITVLKVGHVFTALAAHMQ